MKHSARTIAAKSLLNAAFILTIATSATSLSAEEEDREPTPFEIGLAKGFVAEFSPETGELLDLLMEAKESHDQAKVDATLSALRKAGIDQQYTSILSAASQLSNFIDKTAEELGASLGRGTAKFLKKNLSGSNRTQLPPHVVRASDGRFEPAPGYTWLTQADNDFRVQWIPGKAHSSDDTLVAAEEPDTWLPARGYEWATNPAFKLQTQRIRTSSPTHSTPTVGTVYHGNVGRLNTRFQLVFSANGNVGGSYTYPGTGRTTKYRLEGKNTVEGQLFLREYSDGIHSADVHLVKRLTATHIIWEGIMYNIDGRRHAVTMRRDR